MDPITQSIHLYFRARSPLPTVNAQIGDTNRTIRISIWDGLRRYLLQPDTTAILSARKPDGTSLYSICEIRDNYVYYHFTEQTTSCLGLIRAELRLYGGEQDLLTTTAFLICVHSTAFLPADAVKSKDEQTALNALVNRTQELQNNILDWKQNHQLDGYSAYEIARQQGFAGTEEQRLQSLRYDHSEEFQALARQVHVDLLAAAASAGQAQTAVLQAEGHSGNASAAAKRAEASKQGAQQAQAAAETQAGIALRESAAAQKSREAADLSAGHAAVSEQSITSYGESVKQQLDHTADLAEASADLAVLHGEAAKSEADRAKLEADRAMEQADRGISMGLTGAAVGQIPRIAGITPSGIPTAWTTAIFPDGFEKIASITIADNEQDVTSVSFTNDLSQYSSIFLIIAAAYSKNADFNIAVYSGYQYLTYKSIKSCSSAEKNALWWLYSEELTCKNKGHDHSMGLSLFPEALLSSPQATGDTTSQGLIGQNMGISSDLTAHYGMTFFQKGLCVFIPRNLNYFMPKSNFILYGRRRWA